MAISSPALGQEAAESRIWVSIARSSGVVMMVSDVPQSAPAGPFEYWEWQFLAEPAGEPGAQWNVAAMRIQFNCATRTGERLYSEVYSDGFFVARYENRSVFPPAAAGSLSDLARTGVCDPSTLIGRPMFRDLSAARRGADAEFAAP
jgi:hypothetical protein